MHSRHSSGRDNTWKQLLRILFDCRHPEQRACGGIKRCLLTKQGAYQSSPHRRASAVGSSRTSVIHRTCADAASTLTANANATKPVVSAILAAVAHLCAPIVGVWYCVPRAAAPPALASPWRNPMFAWQKPVAGRASAKTSSARTMNLQPHSIAAPLLYGVFYASTQNAVRGSVLSIWHATAA